MTHRANDTIQGQNFGWFRWIEPWLNRLELLNIITCDVVAVLGIAELAQLLGRGLELIAPKPLVWTMKGITIALPDVAHYGDLGIFVVFFFVAAYDLIVWAGRR